MQTTEVKTKKYTVYTVSPLTVREEVKNAEGLRNVDQRAHL